jgi:hypothetical protein
MHASLTPSHAVKGNRRYRYYVSSSLMKGALRKPGQGWRVPALEIERNLAAAVGGILDERTAVVADVDKAGLGAHDIISILAAAAEWSTRLRSEAEASTALETLVDRAELHPDGIRLSIRLPIPTFGKPAASATTHLSLTRQIPLRVRRRGIEMRLVIGGGSGSAPRIDSTILKATARARRWFDDLVSGRAASMVEIGKREGVGKRYVSRMIRLSFLAPRIIERIAEGRQPPELTAQFLSTSRGDLPLSWQAQEKLPASQIQPDHSAVQEITQGLFQCFRFHSIESTNFCAPTEPQSPPPKRAMERKRENRATRPCDSLSPVSFNCEYSRPRGIIRHA